MKPSNFGHMISRGQEAYPVSRKQSRLVKMIVFDPHTSNFLYLRVKFCLHETKKRFLKLTIETGQNITVQGAIRKSLRALSCVQKGMKV